MIALRICYLCVHQRNNFQIKAFVSRLFVSILVIYKQCPCSAQKTEVYALHHCTWISGERKEKLIQHQNRKLDFMHHENYV